MGKSATATDRAPRGTKVLAQAFFTAADGIPDDRRDAVVKAPEYQAPVSVTRGGFPDAMQV